MPVVGKRVTVGTTATLITTGRGGEGPLGTSAFGATIKNSGSVTCDLGGPGVATGAGFPLAAGDSVDVGDLGADDAVYAVTATSSTTLSVLETA